MNLNLLVFEVLMVMGGGGGGGGGGGRTALFLLFSSSSACKILMNVENIIIKTTIKTKFCTNSVSYNDFRRQSRIKMCAANTS